MKYSNQSNDFYGRPAIGRFFFFPKGTLTHHLRSRRWYPSRGSGRALFPKRPPDASPEGAGNAADLHSAVITCAAGTSAIRRNCCSSHQPGSIAASRLPAKTCHSTRHALRVRQFSPVMCIAPATPIFFFTKRNKNENERTVRTDGDLSFGSESCKPGRRSEHRGSFRLSELF